jgi:uncharacterized protein (UPF0335 family)
MHGTLAVAQDRLRNFVERIENVQAERDQLATDLRDIYAEAKGEGYDPKALKEVVRLRRADPAEREAFEQIVALYFEHVGRK